MNAPDAEVLLRVWEENAGAHPIRRALALLDCAWPETGGAAWAQAPVGVRDGCLMRLYEILFGEQLHTVTRCPACGERLESSFRIQDIRVRPPALPQPGATLALRYERYEMIYRLPNSEDLLRLADGGEQRETALLRQCVVGASRDGAAVETETLPPEALAGLAAEMARQDPDADVRIGLSCVGCRHAWSVGFDIISHFWGELEDWAQRILADVHLLARAYGWAEREILALSPTRRRLYLDMVRA